MTLHFAVENPQGISAMALAALLKEVTAGASIQSIAAIPEGVVVELFGDELSMGKTMGLTGMVKMVAGEAKKRL
jgi:cysteine desulfuration protein SufE